ncbi:MAG: DUF502 domain-containing protein [Endomicrobiales bacterium]|nr:DUF502 domain-containing protein [Endomicrobiales bacterium]
MNLKSFKRYFITGVITILPLWLTLIFIWLMFNWISGFTAPFLKTFFLIFGKKFAGFIVNIISFFLTLFVIWFTGVLATHIFGRRILIGIEKLVIKVPILSEIYLSVRKFIQFFSQKRAFRRVVLVEFPRKDVYSVGFITVESFGEIQEKTSSDYLTVFIPTTPNATTGFLVYMKKSEIIPLDMKVDEAIRLIISGGIIAPEKSSIVDVIKEDGSKAEFKGNNNENAG